jgi:nitric oxide reductase NorQ protein
MSSTQQGATTVNTQRCPGYGAVQPHDDLPDAFSKGKSRCKACTSLYFKDWAAKKRGSQPKTLTDVADRLAAQVIQSQPAVEPVAVEPVSERKVEVIERNIGHTYRPNPKMVRLWDAILKAAARGDHLVLAMHGPHGSGKTDGAEYLAKRADRPLVKVDAKSMVDAEAWFGTRGAVEGSTFYHPSEFVKAIQSRSVVQIDEYTRVSNDVRDVLNPLMDGSRTVLNPITGDRITLHPECVILLSGNVGFKYTGSYDVDPATTSRLAVINIDYPEHDDEVAIIREHAGIEAGTAERLVQLAVETRNNPQMEAVSTRQLLQAAVLIRDGLDETEAVEAKIINAASDQGDGGSARARLATLWGGIANVDAPKSTDDLTADEVAQ